MVRFLLWYYRLVLKHELRSLAFTDDVLPIVGVFYVMAPIQILMFLGFLLIGIPGVALKELTTSAPAVLHHLLGIIGVGLQGVACAHAIYLAPAFFKSGFAAAWRFWGYDVQIFRRIVYLENKLKTLEQSKR